MDKILEKYGVEPLKAKKSKPKKVSKKFTGAGLKIVDSDDGMTVQYGSRPQLKNVIDDDDDMEEDELPQIAKVVDERPIEVQLQEEFKKSNKWKTVVTEFDQRQTSLQSAGEGSRNIKATDADISSRRNRSPGSDDMSPPRSKKSLKERNTRHRRRSGSDLDFSPPRRSNKDDRDTSPPRKRKDVKSLPEKSHEGGRSSVDRRRSHQADLDTSPPRKRREEDRRGNSRRDLDRNTPPRNSDRGTSRRDDGTRRKRSSPPRRSARDDNDASPPRRRRKDDSDISPPRKSHKSNFRNLAPNSSHKNDSDASPPRRSRKDDSDASPPRRSRKDDSDASPPRRSRKDDSDASPPRRNHREDSDESPPRRRGPQSPERTDKMTKTLDGKRAGLQVAKSLRNELDTLRRAEQEKFSQMDDELTGRYAKTKFRDKETGKLRDFGAEKEKKDEENKKLAERKAQYDRWGKGLKQIEAQEERVQSAMHEMSKPLARYEDDADRDAYLKSIDRDGDPMLKFLAKKKAKSSNSGPAKPTYQGPPPPPNRFGIMPGYRWDGVDRSSGYEKKWFERINSKKAFQEESYKWSVEDL